MVSQRHDVNEMVMASSRDGQRWKGGINVS